MISDASDRDPLEQVAESFLARLRAGEQPALSEYEALHPDLAADIRDLFPALVMMEQGRQCVEDPPDPDPARLTEEQVPHELGEYRLLRQVGRGGMGVVYEAWQESLGRQVALKVLPFNNLARPEHLERFRREARAAARLHHTNIVPVFGVGEDHGIHYYAMQFIHGQGLDAVLEEVRRLRGLENQSTARTALAGTLAQGLMSGRFNGVDNAPPSPPVQKEGREGAGVATFLAPKPSPAQMPTSPEPLAESSTASSLYPRREGRYFATVAAIGEQAAQALAYAHGERVVHRDIKPSNLLLDTQGRVWIADFGLAKADDSDVLTQPGDILGTVRYMAPERFQGQADARSDVYGLGVTLYELLTLRPAFAQSNRGVLVEQIAHQDPPRPRKLDPRIPRDLETIVLKAMAKEPDRRYATAGDMAADLSRFLADRPIHARQMPWRERAWRWCRRNPGVAGLLTSVAVLLVIIAGGIGWTVRDQSARQVALEIEVRAALAEAIGYRSNDLVKSMAAARRAESLLASGGGSEALHSTVQQSLADLQFLAKVEEARLEGAAVKGDYFDKQAAAVAFAAAFQAYGLEPLNLEPREAAQRIAGAAIADQLVSALDYWASRAKPGDRNQLLAVARLADRDPLRLQIRDGLVQGDGPALGRMAQKPDILGQPRVTLELLASFLFQTGQNKAAVDLLFRVQQQYPADFWINHSLAFYLAHSKPPRREEALGFYRAALALRPASPGVYVNLGNALSFLGRYQEAEAASAQAIRLMPGYAMAHYCLGTALSRQGRYKEGEAASRTAIDLKHDFPDAHSNLGLALYGQGRYKEAEAACRQALRLNPQLPQAHCNLGCALLEQHRYKETELSLRTAIDLKHDNPEAYSNLGAALNGQGRYKEAEAVCRQAIGQKHEYPEAHNNLGSALIGQRRSKEAEAAFRLAIRLKHQFPVAHDNLGSALFAQARFKEAELAIRTALGLKPDYAPAHYNLGNISFAQGRWKEAEAAYREAIRFQPDFPEAHTNLGNACAELGQWARAITHYSIALDRNPRLMPARINRIFAYTVLGQWDQADADLASENPKAGPLDDVWFQRACLRLLQGDVSGYQRLCQQLVERIPQTEKGFSGPGAYLASRTCLLRLQGETVPPKVLLWADKALASDPQCPWYLHTRALAHYRGGQWDQAVSSCRQSLETGSNWQGRPVNWLLLGMALQRQGHVEEARSWLDRARQWRAAGLAGPRPEATPPRLMHLSDWLEFEVLSAEAEALRRVPAKDRPG